MKTIAAARVELIRDALMIDSDDDNIIRTDYSGRGMGGRECLAFVTVSGGPTLAQFTLELAIALVDDPEPDVLESLREMFGDLSPWSDSMGLETAFYWPDITVTN